MRRNHLYNGMGHIKGIYCNSIKTSLVLQTWSSTLADKDKLPENWIRAQGFSGHQTPLIASRSPALRQERSELIGSEPHTVACRFMLSAFSWAVAFHIGSSLSEVNDLCSLCILELLVVPSDFIPPKKKKKKRK
jgi:hypothetical protein